MHILLAVGVTILAATQAQPQPTLAPSEPFDLVLVNARFENALSLLSQTSGITIELDESVTPDIRRHRLADFRLHGVKVEEVIDLLTAGKGLFYTVVDAKTIRIFKKR